MQAKFAEISKIRRIPASFLFQTKNRRNFGATIVLMSVKFCKQGDESKRNFAARNFVAKFGAGWTKFRVLITKFRFHETKFRSCGAKFRLSRIRSWLENTAVIIISCKTTCTCKRDHYFKKKHCNACYNCGDNLIHNGAFLLFLTLFETSRLRANTCISAISLKLCITCCYTS